MSRSAKVPPDGAEAPRGAEEGQARLLLAAHDARTDPGLRPEAGKELAPVPCLADGGGRDQQDLRALPGPERGPG